MNKPEHVSEELRKTMESLESLSRVRPGPDFRERVLERLAPVPRSTGFRWERSLSWAAVGLLLVLNTAVAYQRLSGGGARSQLESALTERYGFGERYDVYNGLK